MSKFSKYWEGNLPVEVVVSATEGREGVLPLTDVELYDIWSKIEDGLFKLGEEMFQAGIPIGFINSFDFNRGFKKASKGFAPLSNMLSKFSQIAQRDLGLTAPKTLEHTSLAVSLWLLSSTYCYVASSPKADEGSFVSGKVSVQVSTFNEALLADLGIPLAPRVVKGINKMIESLPEELSAGNLHCPAVEFNKQSIKIPRNKVNFIEDEFMVVPVSLVMGWVKACRFAMRDNIVVVNARKTEGALREFTLTSNSKAVGDVYDRDQELIEMFEILRSLPSQYPYFKSRVHNWEGLHNLNLLYYELGISKDDYPKRMLNLSRVESIQLVPVDEGDEYAKKIRQVRRYANVDVDVVVSQVNEATNTWDVDKKENFLNATLNHLKASVGAVEDSNVALKSGLDFQMKFRQAIDYYSTAYVRSVVDYMLAHPVEFDNFRGNDVNVVSVVDAVVTGVTDAQPVDLDGDDLEF